MVHSMDRDVDLSNFSEIGERINELQMRISSLESARDDIFYKHMERTILDTLGDKTMSIKEIVESTGLHESTVIVQSSIMRDKGMVDYVPVTKNHHYPRIRAKNED